MSLMNDQLDRIANGILMQDRFRGKRTLVDKYTHTGPDEVERLLHHPIYPQGDPIPVLDNPMWNKVGM